MTSYPRGAAETANPAGNGNNEIYTAHQVHTLAQLMLQKIAYTCAGYGTAINPAMPRTWNHHLPQFQSIQQIQPQIAMPHVYGSFYPFIR